MVAKPAIIRQSDVTRIMQGAKAAGVKLGIVVSQGEVRFVPVDETEPEDKLSPLERWRAKRDAKKKAPGP